MDSLGEYRLERELGRGATAKVCLARHAQTGGSVCLKIFHPNVMHDGQISKRIQREIELSTSLHHPHVVRVLDVLNSTDPPALVMEYVEGENLEKFQCRLPYVLPEVSVWIVVQILEALEYSHSRNIIHRDLKPENVLVRKDGKVFVTDFGLARLKDNSLGTRSNVLVGSIDYMSPEQARGDVLTPQSDLFSVASILYFLTTGTRPFSRATPMATLAAIKEEVPESPQKRNPKLSSMLADIVQRGMAKDPEARFSSAKAFKQALLDYLASVGLDEEHFSLGAWMGNSTASTIEALSICVERLIQNCEKALQEGNSSKFLENLSHLSLKAPESPALSRLTKAYRQEKQSEKKKALLILFTIGSGILFLLFAFWLVRPSEKSLVVSDASDKKSTVVETAPPPTSTPKKIENSPSSPAPTGRKTVAPVKKVSKIEPKKSPKGIAPKNEQGVVRFNVAPDVVVYWDGKKVDPKKGLVGQKVGEHFLLLERPGFDPIRTRIFVKAGEPTEIKVR